MRLFRHLALILLAFAFAMVMLGFLAGRASAHGDAAWIAASPRYVDQTGAHCCGVSDCNRRQAVYFREAPEGIYVGVGAGDEILMKRDMVGRGLYPSIDDDWWICVRAGVVKCVFKPTSGT